jgi:hypothetical protein
VTDEINPPPNPAPGPLPEGGVAPAGEDEFAGIPSARRRHPVIVLGTAALACFLIFQLRDDLLFALSPGDVQDLGNARQVSGKKIEELPINRMARLAGKADRESAVILDTQGSWRFGQFFRLLGTNNRIFVKRAPDPLSAEQATHDVFVGRLARFSDLSFQAAIRRYFVGHVSATHFFSPNDVRTALLGQGGSLQLTDRLGDRVSLSANDELALEVARPDQIRIDFPRERFRDEAAARAAVVGQGGQVVETPSAAADFTSWALVVTFAPERRDQALHALGEMDPRLRIRPSHEMHRVRIADLGATGDAITIKNGTQVVSLLLTQIQAISTQAAVEIPDDALILHEGERPREQLKTVIIAAFLLAFAILNLLALRRRDS